MGREPHQRVPLFDGHGLRLALQQRRPGARQVRLRRHPLRLRPARRRHALGRGQRDRRAAPVRHLPAGLHQVADARGRRRQPRGRRRRRLRVDPLDASRTPLRPTLDEHEPKGGHVHHGPSVRTSSAPTSSSATSTPPKMGTSAPTSAEIVDEHPSSRYKNYFIFNASAKRGRLELGPSTTLPRVGCSSGTSRTTRRPTSSITSMAISWPAPISPTTCSRRRSTRSTRSAEVLETPEPGQHCPTTASPNVLVLPASTRRAPTPCSSRASRA